MDEEMGERSSRRSYPTIKRRRVLTSRVVYASGSGVIHTSPQHRPEYDYQAPAVQIQEIEDLRNQELYVGSENQVEYVGREIEEGDEEEDVGNGNQETDEQEHGVENENQESDQEDYVESENQVDFVGREIEEEDQETAEDEHEIENENRETDQEGEDDNNSGNEDLRGEEEVVPMSPTTSDNGSNSVVTIMDSDVLDCPICCAPFTIPVFQCQNGHTACSSCCFKFARRCPFCSQYIGFRNRCRAIEKVLESAKISCHNAKYGCKETVSYIKKGEHVQTCIYAPCSCPISGCSYISASKHLYNHLSSRHAGDAKRFEFNQTFPVFLKKGEKFLVLQEEKEAVVFIMNHSSAIIFGYGITVSCLGPLSEGGYFYELTAKCNESSLSFRSFTECIRSRIGNRSPLAGHLVVPCMFFDTPQQITLDLCIWRKGECPWKSTSTAAA